MIWNAAVSPAVIVCAAGEAVIAKSVTCTPGNCATNAPNGSPLALAWPEIERGFGTVMGTAGGMSISTVAVALPAIVEILQEMICPSTAPQLPDPLVTLAVGVDARPLVGIPVALNTTRFATSGPLLVMVKVNATCVPAATDGCGDGLVLGTVTFNPFTPLLLNVNSVTNASWAPVSWL